MLKRVLALAAAGLLVGATVAAPAAAQDGGGLYEPFPEPAPSKSVRGFLADLEGGGARLSATLADRELEMGVFVRRGHRAPDQVVRARPASTRAGRAGDAELLGKWAVLLVAGGVAALGLVLARRFA